MIPDGGRYTETHYAWYNPDTGGYLYHTEANGEYADPFFEEEDDARNYLDRLAEAETKQEYEHLSLHKLKAKKIGEAVEVLTDQAGIGDFAPDGGRPEHIHQIPNPHPDRVWFWYDPAADVILQEEVEPYQVVGLFETEIAADRFVHWYTDQYGIDDVTHLEKYHADLSYEGQGPEPGSLAGTEVNDGKINQTAFTEFLEE